MSELQQTLYRQLAAQPLPEAAKASPLLALEVLKKAAKVTKGSGQPAVRSKKGDLSYNFVADITLAQVEEIAKIKLPDLNTDKVQSAMNTVMGTAKNMGIVVTE